MVNSKILQFKRTKRDSIRLGIVAVAWLCALGGAFWSLAAYESTSGRPGDSPGDWPVSTSLSRTAGLPTLVVITHVKCPCTRATLHELDRIMAHAQGRVRAYVLINGLEGAEADWRDQLLWKDALDIPGVEVIRDDSGNETRHFGALTSGQAALYDAEGKLVFSGGITTSRGHEGDSAGEDAILDKILNKPNALRSSEVFGCPIFAQESASDRGIASCKP